MPKNSQWEKSEYNCLKLWSKIQKGNTVFFVVVSEQERESKPLTLEMTVILFITDGCHSKRKKNGV